jgi:hypothetical protein
MSKKSPWKKFPKNILACSFKSMLSSSDPSKTICLTNSSSNNSTNRSGNDVA